MILGAAVAVGAALTAIRERLSPRIPPLRGALGGGLVIVAAAAIAVVSSRPFAPMSSSAQRNIAGEGALDVRVARLLPTIRSGMPAPNPPPATAPGALGSADPALLTVFVPRHRLPRSAVDLGLPLTSIAVLNSKGVDLAGGYPRVGSIVYIDGRIDPTSIIEATAPLRVEVPTTVGGVRIVPLKVDVAAQIWIVLVTAAP